MGCENKILLLSGPQHFDERRPITEPLRRYAEHINPLGIAIVSSIAKAHGLEVAWREMVPTRIQDLEGAIEAVGGVFISIRHFDTSLAQKTIEIAKANGKKVVVGGYGPTFNPQAFLNADAIVKGEIEPIGNELMDGYRSSRLEPLYDSTGLPPHNMIGNYVWPDRTIFPKWPKLFEKLRRHPQEWQRGCTNFCNFCSPTRLQRAAKDENQQNYVRVRKVTDIIAEIEAMGLDRGSYLFSTDLNTSAIPTEDLKELFCYLKKMGIRWFTEGTVAPLLEDFNKNGGQGLLGLMSPEDGAGGCYSFLYGVDDLVARRVAGSFDKEIAILGQAVSAFRKMGIPLNLSVVVGLDNHHYPGSFFLIKQALEEVKAPYSFIHLATPYHGTPWGKKVIREDRIIDGESTHYNHREVVHIPRNMTPEQLQQGYYWLLRTLNSPTQLVQTARVNLDTEMLAKNPMLAVIQTGIPWGVETYLATLELKARGYLNPKIQDELDHGYTEWVGKKSRKDLK